MVSIDLSENAGDPSEKKKWKLGQISRNIDAGTSTDVCMGSPLKPEISGSMRIDAPSRMSKQASLEIEKPSETLNQ